MTILETCGDAVRRARHRDDQRRREYFVHALDINFEMDRKSAGNKLDRAEGALTDVNGIRPL
jgi:hypothetical protein